MDNDQELRQELFDSIGLLKDTITAKRIDLASKGKISPAWPINKADISNASNFISTTLDTMGLSSSDKNVITDEIKNFFDSLGVDGNEVTVAALEGRLLEFQAQINLQMLQSIIANISGAGKKITNATAVLKDAIDELNNLNKIFSAITVGVNLVAALLAASGGKFDLLIQVVSAF
jgi:hypothetical protein